MPLDLPAAFRLNARLGRFLTDRSRGLALWSAWMTAHSAVIVAIEQAITFTTWLFGGMGILRHLFHRFRRSGVKSDGSVACCQWLPCADHESTRVPCIARGWRGKDPQVREGKSFPHQ